MSDLRVALSALGTEGVDPAFARLDALPTLAAARLVNAADATVATAVERVLPQVAEAVDRVAAGMRGGGRLVYAGAGTAGRLGVLDASECPPTFDTDPAQVVGLIAGGPTALTTAVEGAEDDTTLAERDVAALRLGPADSLVGISASGRTPYALAAVRCARDVGAFTAGLACNRDSALGRAAEVAIEVEVGPEVLAGSTRMKSGTAQKLVLNMISTLTMVRLGKTYGNLMVDLRATNEKLTARSWRIVHDATGAADDEVDDALADAGGEVKTAIAVLVAGVDVDTARAALVDAGGVLRAALLRLTSPPATTAGEAP
ncbi:N-acetylmuramic acid 6-phosphate etherase [Marmoricola endophyticus]|uniref:N-acetylmuramic acid 6-phosphate etherase n=1 Tax=Marmoricola endophyticus TaxID=2040280 RepID=A0A917BTX7_9ACTN|nr:N-acetylmuramic acid 6-phosphate etherase [Marmoricola endophyticus]GGF58706.1 N-acetylmuramic acid 6-phosphate etherase [Marmoricola endophyticus]